MTTIAFFSLFLSLVFIALFAASEAALAATNRVRLRHLLRAQSSNEAPGEASTPAPYSSEELSAEAQRFIATVTIAANVPVAIAASLTVYLAVMYLGFSIEAGITCVATALLCVAIFQIAPRLLVSHSAARTPIWVRPARLLVGLLKLPVGVLMLLGTLILRPFGLLNAPRATPINGEQTTDEETRGEEIRDLVGDLIETSPTAASPHGGRELFESIFTFGDTRAHEVMIPRPDILALDISNTTDQILRAFEESGFSRLPLHESDVDHLVGILHVNDVLRCISEDKWDFDARQLMRAPMFVPETRAIDEVFAAMRASRTHLAIAIDEYGGTAGLLTIEDILEELVGEIADEHDRKTEEPLVILDEHSAIADALLHIEDLEEEWDLDLSGGKFDTVGGFMIEQLGRAPNVGDRIETAEAVLTIHAVRGKRPHKIMIVKAGSEDESGKS